MVTSGKTFALCSLQAWSLYPNFRENATLDASLQCMSSLLSPFLSFPLFFYLDAFHDWVSFVSRSKFQEQVLENGVGCKIESEEREEGDLGHFQTMKKGKA